MKEKRFNETVGSRRKTLWFLSIHLERTRTIICNKIGSHLAGSADPTGGEGRSADVPHRLTGARGHSRRGGAAHPRRGQVPTAACKYCWNMNGAEIPLTLAILFNLYVFKKRIKNERVENNYFSPLITKTMAFA